MNHGEEMTSWLYKPEVAAAFKKHLSDSFGSDTESNYKKLFRMKVFTFLHLICLLDSSEQLIVK